jgi:hypothetical protein
VARRSALMCLLAPTFSLRLGEHEQPFVGDLVLQFKDLVRFSDPEVRFLLDDSMSAISVTLMTLPNLSHLQGFAYLRSGVCVSKRPVSYEQTVAWKVLSDDDTPHSCLPALPRFHVRHLVLRARVISLVEMVGRSPSICKYW